MKQSWSYSDIYLSDLIKELKELKKEFGDCSITTEKLGDTYTAIVIDPNNKKEKSRCG